MEKSFGVFLGTGSMAKNAKVKVPTVGNMALEEGNGTWCSPKVSCHHPKSQQDKFLQWSRGSVESSCCHGFCQSKTEVQAKFKN